MVKDRTFKGTVTIEIKQELSLEILEERLINLIELAIPEKKNGRIKGGNSKSDVSKRGRL
jgi:hypothetical protein